MILSSGKALTSVGSNKARKADFHQNPDGARNGNFPDPLGGSPALLRLDADLCL